MAYNPAFPRRARCPERREPKFGGRRKPLNGTGKVGHPPRARARRRAGIEPGPLAPRSRIFGHQLRALLRAFGGPSPGTPGRGTLFGARSGAWPALRECVSLNAAALAASARAPHVVSYYHTGRRGHCPTPSDPACPSSSNSGPRAAGSPPLRPQPSARTSAVPNISGAVCAARSRVRA